MSENERGQKKPARERCAYWLNFCATLTFASSVLGNSAPLAAETIATPNFWDQRQRLTKPPLDGIERIRFLTSLDFPPFNFLDGRGRLSGFNVDLVRAACDELGLVDRCQIEARPFADLLPALLRGEGDAVVAGLAVTAQNGQTLAFTQSYFRYPARFATRKTAPLPEPLGRTVDGRRIGVVAASAHEAMLRAFFPKAVVVPFKSREDALVDLQRPDGGVDAVFDDGVALSFWLESEPANGCCAFSGGPYLSDRFLGEGLAIAVPKANETLSRALDYAIGQIVAKRTFSELLLRYFPVSAF